MDQVGDLAKIFLNLKDHKQQLMVKKYSQTYSYALVQKHIFDLEVIYKQTSKQKIDVFDFVLNMLNFTNQPPNETIFVVIELIEFFKSICDGSRDQQYIIFSDISNYITDANPLNESIEGKDIATRLLPNQPKAKEGLRRVRDIDINAPIVIGGESHDIIRLNKDQVYVDSTKKKENPAIRVLFSQSLKQIFVLNQYTSHILVYNPDCTVSRTIDPKSNQLNLVENLIILDICWSEKQLRLAATLKDQWLCFWDAENWDYSKVFKTTQQEHIKIYYLNTIDKWLTIDSAFVLHIWDIQIEKAIHSIPINGTVVDVLDIEYLQLTCIVGNNSLMIWDLKSMRMLYKVNTYQSHLHSAVFFRTYQVLLACGYDSQIYVYQLHHKYNEGQVIGKLEGHFSLVTAIQVIEDSPIVVTCDDKHNVKLWDIRILKCIQTFHLDIRWPIGQIIVLRGIQALCLVSQRMLVIEMEGCTNRMTHWKKFAPKLPESKQNVPSLFAYDATRKIIFICTKRDILLYQLSNGRCFKIIRGFDDNGVDEITTFRGNQQNCIFYQALQRQLIVGTQNGNVKIFDSESGQLIREWQAHSNEISQIFMDHKHQIITTSSFDSTILMWKESQTYSTYLSRQFKFEKAREINNAHHNGPVLLMEVSVHQNLVVTCSQSPTLMLWDYQFGKLIATLTLEDQNEPTAVIIVDGYSLVIVADNNGSIFFLTVVGTGHRLEITLISRYDTKIVDYGKYKIDKQISKSYSKQNSLIKKPLTTDSAEFYNKLAFKVVDKTQLSFLFAASNNKGDLKLFELSSFFKQHNLKPVPHSSTGTNYNPRRSNRENFLTAVNFIKTQIWYIRGMILELEMATPHVPSKTPCIIFTEMPIGSKTMAHRDNLTHIDFICFEGDCILPDSTPSMKIVTSSLDETLKIWSTEELGLNRLKLIGNLNINHPLPIAWSITLQEVELIKFKLAFAMKVINFINQNCQLSHKLQKIIDPSKILRILIPHDEYNPIQEDLTQNEIPLTSRSLKKKNYSTDFITEIQQPNHKKQNIVNEVEHNKVHLLQEEFTPLDIHRDKQNLLNKRLVEGLTLKQMEENKKVFSFAQQWKQQQKDSQLLMDQLNSQTGLKDEERKKETRAILSYLHADYRRNILHEYEIEKQIMINEPTQFEQDINQLESQLKNQIQKDLRAKDDIIANPSINSNVSMFNLKQRTSVIHNQQPDQQATDLVQSLPKINELHLPIQSKTSCDFFQYAQVKQLHAKKSFNLQRSVTQNSQMNLMDIDNGALNSKTPSLNLQNIKQMRKNTTNLFTKIVVNLDHKLKASKFSYRNSINNQSIVTKDTTLGKSQFQQENSHLLSKSKSERHNTLSSYKIQPEQQIFGEKNDGTIHYVREKFKNKKQT